MNSLDLKKIRSEFPILSRKVNGKPLVYLDNAATLQKPQAVLDSLVRFYSETNANVHRGVHFLSQAATDAYEGVRTKVCKLLGTTRTQEIIFTKGATEALNLLASSLGESVIHEGDTIAITRMEHHANFVPWQSLAIRKKLKLIIIELDSEYRIDPQALTDALAKRPKIVALTAMSDVTGVANDLAAIARAAKKAGALVVADCAQAVIHGALSVPSLEGLDFLVFSSHKMGGPTGVGVLWGRETLLKALPPYQFGGDMISLVNDLDSTWADLPWKFEAGTPNFADVAAFGTALDYLETLGWNKIQEQERSLTEHALGILKKIPSLKIYGPQNLTHRGPVLSFAVSGIHPHDLSSFLDMEGIAVRAGHHCAQPLLRKMEVAALTRASLSFYNTPEEIDHLGATLVKAIQYFDRGKEGRNHV